ncbi:FtsK/SpoIIIE domain-containing protein [Falsarthrobacter nasiphocae]|uniref:FtsK domain-containing protein n=1 Tax=Falsarthrobacter nasiphocae TaxID=189863 RepID=A0AAE4C7G2_9MICC|nr:FtsK/SpoIIIE domain-containing protein [Falsarthrobacter nasiphocae]MDR6891415.1 hypothetical protein [Falsarthrobacter nasiphocae]
MTPFTLLATPAAAARFGLPSRLELAVTVSGWDGGDQAIDPSSFAHELPVALGHLALPGWGAREVSASALAAWLEPTSFPLRPGGEVLLRCPATEGDILLSPTESSGGAPLSLVCLSGPDAGRTLPVPRGESTLGRGADLHVTDPYVSRCALRVTVSSRTTEVRPLGGHPVLIQRGDTLRAAPRRGCPLKDGDVLILGTSRIQAVFLGSGAVTSIIQDASGERPAGFQRNGAAAPVPPAEPRGEVPLIPRSRIVLAALPLVVSCAVAVILGQPLFLLFGVISVGALAGPLLERRSALRERRKLFARREAFARAAAAFLFPPVALRCVGLAGSAQRLDLAAKAPEVGLPTQASEPDGSQADPPRGGTRRPTSRTSPPGSAGSGSGPIGSPAPGTASRGSALAGSSSPEASVHIAPARPSPWIVWRLGSYVDRDERLPVETGLILAPDATVRITVTSPDPTSVVAGLSVSAGGMACSNRPGPSQPAVWLHPADTPVALARLPWVSLRPGAAPVHVCRTADCTAANVTVVVSEGPLVNIAGTRPWVPDHARADTLLAATGNTTFPAEHALAPLSTGAPPVPPPGGIAPSTHPGTPGRGIPTMPWSAVPLTRTGADAPFLLDLEADGPHVLVVGTTGCGKTELLKTVIARLILGSPPDRLRLFLIDFKGGSGLSLFEDVEHVDGVVSDLDGADVERVLASLAAELTRRELWLKARRLPDARGLPAGDAPPRLVIVIDELRALVDSVPGAAAKLARIAAVGRSLGVHLILASQRAQGAASPDLRTNIGTTIVLRVASEADSLDVLSSPVAASISPSAAGTFYVRAAGRTRGPFLGATWRECVGRTSPTITTWPPGPALRETGDADPQLLARAAPRASSRRRWPRAVAPPLPRGERHLPSGATACCLLDNPSAQSVVPLSAPLAHCLVFGAADDVTADALRSVTRGLISTGRATRVLAAVATPALADITAAALAFVPPSDALGLDELMTWLPQPESGDLVIIEGLDSLLDTFRAASSHAGEDVLGRWLAGALHVGATVVASSVREPPRLAASFGCRIYLPRALAQTARLFWPKEAAESTAPGRGFIVGPWQRAAQGRRGNRTAQAVSSLECSHEVQVLSPGGDASGASAALRPASAPALRPLPERAALPPAALGAVTPGARTSTDTDAAETGFPPHGEAPQVLRSGAGGLHSGRVPVGVDASGAHRTARVPPGRLFLVIGEATVERAHLLDIMRGDSLHGHEQPRPACDQAAAQGPREPAESCVSGSPAGHARPALTAAHTRAAPPAEDVSSASSAPTALPASPAIMDSSADGCPSAEELASALVTRGLILAILPGRSLDALRLAEHATRGVHGLVISPGAPTDAESLGTRVPVLPRPDPTCAFLVEGHDVRRVRIYGRGPA